MQRAGWLASRDLHWPMLYSISRLILLIDHAGGLALRNPIYCEPNDKYGSTVRLAISKGSETPVLWNLFKACCQSH